MASKTKQIEGVDFKAAAKTFTGAVINDPDGKPVMLKTVLLSALRNAMQLLPDASDEDFYRLIALGQAVAQDRTTYSPEEIVLLKRLVRAKGHGIMLDVVAQMLSLLGDDKLHK